MSGERKSYPEYDGILAPLIRRHRERQGLRQWELAAVMGYFRGPNAKQKITGWTMIESGERGLTTAALFKVAEALGPDFVDDVADEMFKAAKRGLEHKRDQHLEDAQQAAKEIRDAKRRPRPVGFDESFDDPDWEPATRLAELERALAEGK